MKGLANVNASCFMNAVLQSLFTSEAFNNYVLKALSVDKYKTLSDYVIGAYCQLSGSLTKDRVVKVEDFVNTVREVDSRWEGMNDSLEFLQYMLERMEALTGENLSLVRQKTFYTMKCGHVGVVEDQESAENYLYPNYLSDAEYVTEIDYRCPKCQDETKLMATVRIQEWPKMLVVVLSSEDKEIKDKVGNYSLKSIYCYSGQGNFGHYYSVICSYGKFIICDDYQVQEVTSLSKRVLSAAKYLIYE